MCEQPTVVAVVVAWNREDLLRDTLRGLNEQSRATDGVIVIDNASTDNSAQIAQSYSCVTEVITLPRNVGGAGGFAAGIARAVHTHNADLVWIMDDDTAPTPTALEELLKARHDYPGQPAVLASRAVWYDGREHPMNRPRPRPLLSSTIAKRAQDIGCITVRTASFVSILIDTRAILEQGLPQADFFLWNDDFDYTSRLLRHRIGLYVPNSVVLHQTQKFGDSSEDPGARFKLEVRNKLWTFTRSNGLNLLERVLYGGRSTLRWGQTLMHSSNRTALLNYAKEGFHEGLLTKPTSNAQLFVNTPVYGDVAAIEAIVSSRKKDTNLTGTNQQITTACMQEELGTATTHVDQYDLRFSVLMSVYERDVPEHVERALRSISKDQTLQPSQIVLIQDGPVSQELSDVLEHAEDITGMPVTFVQLETNQGLANALNAGLLRCDYPLIARADADDIAVPTRFARQIPLMVNLDLLGSAIVEFEDDENELGLVRQQPITSEDISKAARFRDPFNHPTVIFRKAAMEAIGGYPDCGKMEDYLAFCRIIHAGGRVANLAEPLVKYRVGRGAYRRRGGLDLFLDELKLQRILHQEGFTNTLEWLRNSTVRSTYRLLPTHIRKKTYHTIGKLRWFRE